MSELRTTIQKPWGLCRTLSSNPSSSSSSSFPASSFSSATPSISLPSSLPEASICDDNDLNNNNNNNNRNSRDAEEGESIENAIQALLCGDVSTYPLLSSKIVRVFISSTFSDMVYERNILMESVYPELKNFCRETYRLEFQMVDLRWGIREEAHDNHTIIDFCLKEIENCRNISIGPNFVVLLGQKYGFRPFPPIIDAKEFEAIQCELRAQISAETSLIPSAAAATTSTDLKSLALPESSLLTSEKATTTTSSTNMTSSTPVTAEEVKLLDDWFRKDTNILPHEYVLQPISSLLPDFGNEDNQEKNKAAQNQWNDIRLQLLNVLRKGVTLCVQNNKLQEASKNKYFVSVTEYEIERGLLNVSDASDTCLCFVRTVENLEDNRHMPRARLYLDFLNSNTDDLDLNAQQLLNDLQNEKIAASLTDERNYEYFKLEWTDRENRDPADDDEYLQKFCDSFREKMQWLINKSAQKINKINSMPKMVEIVQQLEMCRCRSDSLRGRESTLKKIRLYLISTPTNSPSSLTSSSSCSSSSSPNRPLVLFGESGCGKTSVSAKVAYEARSWYQQYNGTSPVVVFRFLGTTCYSCSVRLMLGSICWQIAKAYSLDVNDIPSDYPGLVFYFHELLKKSTENKPLVLIFDGLDQLASTHRAHGLAWLPFYLPDHVKIVVSTVPDKYGILSILMTQLADVRHNNFEEIKPLGVQLSFSLIKEWLSVTDIDLTEKQFRIVKEALDNCSLPLYTILVFEQIRQWRSYYTPDQTIIEKTIETIISSLFDRIELNHGQVFVSHTLSYLTASREGLSDVELEDVLSLDDNVLNDVFQHWLPPLRRIPPLLVPRLQIELSSYIIQRETNGTMVYYWYHAQFIDVARKRYLSKETHKTYVHHILAHYFLGTWGGGKKKAYICPEKQTKLLANRNLEGLEDRKVPTQPLIFGKPGCNGLESDPDNKPNYNLRKLCELPYHLLESRMYLDLTQQVLFNYEWLYTKLTALSLHDALSDFTLTVQQYDNKEDISLLYSALRMSGSQINSNPRSLALDLIGRLLHYYDDHERCTNIRRLLQQCDQQSLKHSALIPLQQCFEPPKLSVLFVLEGHNQQVSDIIINDETNELISVSKDGYLAFWDLVGGERSRTIDISGLNPGRLTRLFQSKDGKYLIVDSDFNESPILVLNTKIGQILSKCGCREATTRRGFIAGNLFCRQKSIIDIEKGQQIKRIEDFTSNKNYVACALTPDGQSILLAETDEIKMFNISDGAMLKCIKNVDDNVVSVLQVSDDSRVCYCGSAISLMFSVFDIDKSSDTFGRLLLQFDCSKFLDHSFVPLPCSSQMGLMQEIWDITLCTNNSYLVLINVCRNSLISYSVRSETITVMKQENEYTINNTDKRSSRVKSSFGFNKSLYNFGGSLVLASHSNYLSIWKAESGQFLQKIIIHSTSDFPYPWCVSKTRNLVATGSTIDTAVRVWDLDRTENADSSNLKVYMNPIDCITCDPNNRLVYVKSYYGLDSSSNGYKFFDRFAIDVWNVSTGNWKCFIPFFKYGRLIEMKCSFDGKYLALLLNSLSQWYVVVLNVANDEVQCAAGHDVDWQCKQYEFRPDWEYMASYASLDLEDEVILWNVKKNKKIVSFHEAKNPIFTLDCQYLLYIDAGVNIIIYSLKNFAPAKCQLQIFPDKLTCIPVKHHSILVTSYKENLSTVSVWDFHGAGKIKCEMENISKNGFADLSKNGNLAVDDLLQVFDINTGTLVRQFQRCHSNLKDSNEKLTTVDNINPKLIKLTYDGLYCVWFEEVTCLIKVGSVANGYLIAQSNLHENVTSLETMDYGYVLFCGRQDGHIITMKLMPLADDNTSTNTLSNYKPKNETDRRNYILDLDPCQNLTIQQFDRLFRQPSQHIDDSEICVASSNVYSQLSKHAELPRLFTFLKPQTGASKLSNSNLSVPNSPSVLMFAQQNNFFPPSGDAKLFQKNKKLADFTNISLSSMSLPRKNNHIKPDIRLVTSSSASLETENSASSQGSPQPVSNSSPVFVTSKKYKSAQELCKLNGSLSKTSLDSLIDKVDRRCKKTVSRELTETTGNEDIVRVKTGGNLLGRHSLKIPKQKAKNKLLALFSHLRPEKKFND